MVFWLGHPNQKTPAGDGGENHCILCVIFILKDRDMLRNKCLLCHVFCMLSLIFQTYLCLEKLFLILFCLFFAGGGGCGLKHPIQELYLQTPLTWIARVKCKSLFNHLFQKQLYWLKSYCHAMLVPDAVFHCQVVSSQGSSKCFWGMKTQTLSDIALKPDIYFLLRHYSLVSFFSWEMSCKYDLTLHTMKIRYITACSSVFISWHWTDDFFERGLLLSNSI